MLTKLTTVYKHIKKNKYFLFKKANNILCSSHKINFDVFLLREIA